MTSAYPAEIGSAAVYSGPSLTFNEPIPRRSFLSASSLDIFIQTVRVTPRVFMGRWPPDACAASAPENAAVKAYYELFKLLQTTWRWPEPVADAARWGTRPRREVRVLFVRIGIEIRSRGPRENPDGRSARMTTTMTLRGVNAFQGLQMCSCN